jgi:hypothetical protein
MSTWSSGPSPRTKRCRELPQAERPRRPAGMVPGRPAPTQRRPGVRFQVRGRLERLPHPDDCTGRHNRSDRDDDRPNHVFNHACPLKRSRRRRCNALGRSLGSSADRCAISVARSRAALTAAMPRARRSSARLTSLGAAKSCSLVNNFMIRPPTANPSDSNDARSRPSHGHIAYSNVNQPLE